MNWQYQPLGKILVDKGIIDEEQMKKALIEQEENDRPIGEILIRKKYITEEHLAEALANQKHLEVVDLIEYAINPQACSLISQNVAQRNQLIPIDFRDKNLLVATANPLDIQALDNIGLITGFKITPVVATTSSIRESINQFMVSDDAIAELVDDDEVNIEVDEGLDDVMGDDTPVVRLANSIFSEAVKQRASDIHIETEDKESIIRFRVDGVLKEHVMIPQKFAIPLVSRIKIMSDLDIAERRVPQDGRASLLVNGQKIDLRVNTLPSIRGENANMRIMEADKKTITLEDLGMDAESLERFKKCFNKSHGSVLVTGPTGSGKTTSLYSVLDILNVPDKKIITVEDPVEKKTRGITQIQVNMKAGLTFANGLRAIVRHDPDIIMVGEIRDLETAQIAIRAALTGHFVLSTLHTNDAASSVTRLVDMGIEPFLVTSSVKVIIAQRLVRKLCDNCKVKFKMRTTESMKEFGVAKVDEEITFYKPGGCRRCGDTGYQGRLAIFELLTMTDEIGKLCMRGAPGTEIARVAISQGMKTLRQDGFTKARKGTTSLEEISRVLS